MMTLILAIAMQLLAGAMSAATTVLDYYETDKRRLTFRRWRKAQAIFVGVFVVTGVWATYTADSAAEADRARLTAQLDMMTRQSVDAQAVSAAAHAKTQEELGTVKSQLAPFLDVARQRNPGEDDAVALARLQRELASLATLRQSVTAATTALAQWTREHSPDANDIRKAAAKATGCALRVNSVNDVNVKQYAQILMRDFKAAGWATEGVDVAVSTNAASKPPYAILIFKPQAPTRCRDAAIEALRIAFHSTIVPMSLPTGETSSEIALVVVGIPP